MFCPYCGAMIAEGMAFCPSCGGALEQETFTRGANAEMTPVTYVPAPYVNYNRSLLKLVFFTLFSGGIYLFWFVHRLSEDMNIMCEGDSGHTSGVAAFFLLNLLTGGLYTIYWFYMIAERTHLNAPRYGFKVREDGGYFLLWTVFEWILTLSIGAWIVLGRVIQNVNELAFAYDRILGYD